MYSKELLEKYADVLIEKGVNIQKYIKAGMVNIPPVKLDKQE